MSQLLPKVLVCALTVAGAVEMERPSSALGGSFASLPLAAIFAMVWRWHDGTAPAQIADFATSILWLVPPLLLVSPPLLRAASGSAAGAGTCARRIASHGMRRSLLHRAEPR